MDKRSQRTVTKIRNALEYLIVNSNDGDFTIKEITGQAKINRKTFYIHFNCIEDLYEDFGNVVEERLISILESKHFFDNKFSLNIFFDSLLELRTTNKKLYDKLLTEENYRFIFRSVKERIKESVISKFNIDMHNLRVQMEIDYVFSGLIKLFRVWYSRKNEMTKEEMYDTAYNIVKFGISRYDII